MTWHWMHRRTCAKTEGSTCRQITFPKHRRRNHFLGEMRSAPGSWGGTSWGKLYYRLILQKRTNKYQTEVDDKNLKQIHGAFYCFADLLQNKNWATDVAIWVSPILRIIMTSSLKGALSAVLIRHKSAWAVDVGLGYESDSPRSGKKAASCGKKIALKYYCTSRAIKGDKNRRMAADRRSRLQTLNWEVVWFLDSVFTLESGIKTSQILSIFPLRSTNVRNGSFSNMGNQYGREKRDQRG